MRSRLLLLPTWISLAACGPPEPKEKPQIFVNSTKLGFDQEFEWATFIGATTFNTVLIRNDGVQDLVITSASVQGTSFTLTGPDVTTLAYRKTATAQVAFKPTEARVYSGTLTIASNAENKPSVTVDLSGCGVTFPTPDLSYCLKSGDF